MEGGGLLTKKLPRAPLPCLLVLFCQQYWNWTEDLKDSMVRVEQTHTSNSTVRWCPGRRSHLLHENRFREIILPMAGQEPVATQLQGQLEGLLTACSWGFPDRKCVSLRNEAGTLFSTSGGLAGSSSRMRACSQNYGAFGLPVTGS